MKLLLDVHLGGNHRAFLKIFTLLLVHLRNEII